MKDYTRSRWPIRKKGLGLMQIFSETPAGYKTPMGANEEIYHMFRTITGNYDPSYMAHAIRILLDSNQTLKNACGELGSLNVKGKKACRKVNEYIKKLEFPLPAKVLQSASSIGLGEDGSVCVSFTGEGVKILDAEGVHKPTDTEMAIESVSINYTAEKLFDTNKDILLDMREPLETMKNAMNMARRKKQELETGLRFAMVHSIKQYAIGTIKNARLSSLGNWYKRIKITPRNCKNLISKAKNYNIEAGAFAYNPAYDKLREAIIAESAIDDTITALNILGDEDDFEDSGIIIPAPEGPDNF